jgi:hypothetical protein
VVIDFSIIARYKEAIMRISLIMFQEIVRISP